MTPEPVRLASLVVAIDGSSGSGKSSVSRRVAGVLGLACLDTGAMYRAVAAAALDRGIDPGDGAAVAALARAAHLEQSTDPAHESVVIDGLDVTAAIREPRVSAVVSEVARNPEVRAELVARQRAVAEAGAVVIEGRDITTVVAPDAPVRLLLTADAEARVARRAQELHGASDAAALAATRDSIVERDARDAQVNDFFTAADGVVEIDTSRLGFDEVVDAVLQVVVARVPEAAAALEAVR
ncbi:cytidylate kinase [Motilibacter peucedani]|uniref:Cytidylate kinase n=1 Tax=Motilibacter peucedani TaxID=598650 RepID=A0A420XT10_9ACTN|nr:(d)CMP kinase [Motilibacter peucedani]RKS77879.1 cytidylate kinase [Motilibacter peucedani]